MTFKRASLERDFVQSRMKRPKPDALAIHKFYTGQVLSRFSAFAQTYLSNEELTGETRVLNFYLISPACSRESMFFAFQVARHSEPPHMSGVVDIGNLQEFMGTLWSIARQLFAGKGKAHSVALRALVVSELRRPAAPR